MCSRGIVISEDGTMATADNDEWNFVLANRPVRPGASLSEAVQMNAAVHAHNVECVLPNAVACVLCSGRAVNVEARVFSPDSCLTFRLGFVLWSRTVEPYASQAQTLLDGADCMKEHFHGMSEFVYLPGYDEPRSQASSLSNDILGFQLAADGTLTVLRNGSRVCVRHSGPSLHRPGWMCTLPHRCPARACARHCSGLTRQLLRSTSRLPLRVEGAPFDTICDS